ncbi:MAG: hypothetical protein QW806_09265 [Nitrososphaerota archaeon]
MVTFEQFYSSVQGRTNKSYEELQEYFNNFNVQEKTERYKQEFRAELWNNTPINDVSPDIVRQRNNMAPNDLAYLIYKGSQLLYFQPHSINGEKITPNNWLELANKHIESIIDSYILGDLIRGLEVNYTRL